MVYPEELNLRHRKGLPQLVVTGKLRQSDLIQPRLTSRAQSLIHRKCIRHHVLIPLPRQSAFMQSTQQMSCSMLQSQRMDWFMVGETTLSDRLSRRVLRDHAATTQMRTSAWA